MGRKALLVLEFKRVLSSGAIVEARIWQLPAPTGERPHGFKYSLFYGRPGKRIIGYDNQAGKGDHRHFREAEEFYSFVSIERLLADFRDDIAREVRRERNTNPDRGY